MSQHISTRCKLTLPASALFILAVWGLASAAHAQNFGWKQTPAQQAYRPYTSPYNYPQQQRSTLVNYQAAPGYGQQGGQAQSAEAPAVPSSAGYGNGAPATGYNTFGCDSCGCDTGCCDSCCQPCGPCWGGYVGGVYLTREDENHRTFSFDSTDESYQLLDSQESNFDDAYGPEIHLIRRNPCCCTAWEVAYWGVYPDDSFAFAFPAQVAGTLDGIFNFDQLDYNGASADNNVNGAQVHRLRRENEIHNAEFNHLWQLSRGRGGSLWRYHALAGFRYFRFVDNLEFASDPTDTAFTGAVDELYYTMDAENNLYGFQIGGLLERQCFNQSRWSLTCGAKVGAFVNDAEAHSRIGGAAGVATVNNGPNNGLAFDITSDKNDLSMIAELQAGAAYRLSRGWRLRGEYRVIGITGVALPTNQIYQDLRGLQDVQFLSTNGDLVLHGAFFGVDFGY